MVTKVDLMGKNKDALQRMLANEVLPLAMGRIGIRCRTQQEQLDGVGFDEVLNRESQVRKREIRERRERRKEGCINLLELYI